MTASSSRRQSSLNPKACYLLTADIGTNNCRMSVYAVDKEQPLFVSYFRIATHLPEDCWTNDKAFQERILSAFLQDCWNEDGSPKLVGILVPLKESFILSCIIGDGELSPETNELYCSNLGDMRISGKAIEEEMNDARLKRIVKCQVMTDTAGGEDLRVHGVLRAAQTLYQQYQQYVLEEDEKKAMAAAGVGGGGASAAATSSPAEPSAAPQQELAKPPSVMGSPWFWMAAAAIAGGAAIGYSRMKKPSS